MTGSDGRGARRILDISRPLSPALVVWPGDPPFELERIAELEADGCNLSRMAGSVHSGTHVDAPLHYLAEGPPVDALPLDALIGPARVFHLPATGPIDADLLATLDWRDCPPRVLLRSQGATGTGRSGSRPAPEDGSRPARRDEDSSEERLDPRPAVAKGEGDGFRSDFAALDASGAGFLVERGVRLVGIDGPSIALWEDLAAPHRILLAAGAIPLEGLDLGAVPAGDYELICLPLKLVGADGAPARAVLVDSRDPEPARS